MPPSAWFEKSNVYAVAQRVTAARSPGTAQPETLTSHEMAVLNGLGSTADRRDQLLVGVQNLYRKRTVLFKEAYAGDGLAFNSGPYDGLPTADFKRKIIDKLEAEGTGQRKVNTKLRDWLFSRQRYWGEPFPILHEVDAQGKPTGAIETVPLDELPLVLPDLADYKPTGNPEAPLGKAKDWIHVTKNGKRYVRETNTMPQWAGSCWYYLRYIDPRNDQAFCDPDKLKRWLPVDLYVGGAEHAVLHLLYSRFWHKVLFDRGHVPVPEPFQRLVNQGMILGEMEFIGFQGNKKWVSAEHVNFDGSVATHKETGEKLATVKLDEDNVEKKGAFFVHKEVPNVRIDARAFKMSKSRGNVINPDQVVEQYGADALRLYEMFMGPLEAVKPWSMRGVEGVYRFLSRVWRLTINDRAEEPRVSPTVQDVEPDRETLRMLHRTVQRVTDDLEALSFNTAIAAMMEFTNHLTPMPVRPKSALKTLMLLLGPFAPHLAEELWQTLGGTTTLAYEPWPTYDAALLKADEIEVPVQVNGKLKAKLKVSPDIDAAALEAAARADERIKSALEGKTVRKVIIAAGNKLVNFVVG
jgi:leucyl-tRNA synthetase